jgi:hypothetical protein
MAKLFNLAEVYTTSTGSGTVIAGSATTGSIDFIQAGIQDGDTVSYGITDGNNSEVGRGVYTASASSLTRNPLKSTNSGSVLVLSGSAQVFITALAEDIGNVSDTGATTANHLAVWNGASDHVIKDGGVIPTSYPADGRLTLESGVPVSTTDQTAKTNLYYTPYIGDRIALYNGATWDLIAFAELSIAIPATTSQIYDVFIYNNSGTATLELLAWTNDTTRATAIVRQNGILCKTGVLTRRYVGSIRTTASSGQTEDSIVKRYLWNYYHRVPRILRRLETTDSWSYNTATWRQAHGDAANQLDVVIGVAEVAIEVKARVLANLVSVSSQAQVSIGEDSTNTPAEESIIDIGLGVGTGFFATIEASLYKYPAVGRHIYVWLEKGQGTLATSWYSLDATPTRRYGLQGLING